MYVDTCTHPTHTYGHGHTWTHRWDGDFTSATVTYQLATTPPVT